MIRVLKLAAAGGLFVLTAFGQAPAFLAADVRVNPNTVNTFRPPAARGEILEARNVSLADMIIFAYESNITKVLGGPSWLEMDKFDVTATMPPQTPIDQQRKMLRSLLADRFKLVAKEESRPMPSFALTAPGKHKMKEADAGDQPGCRPQNSNAAPTPGGTPGPRILMAGPDGGNPIEIAINDGMIEYRCRNMTMAAFVAGIRSMPVPNLGVNPVTDQTGLSGNWNFDLRYSIGLISLAGGAPQGDQTTFAQAVERQMGLKLEERPIPTQVVVVESANRQPSPNPPGTAEAMPKLATPKEFEVASIKLTSPDFKGGRLQQQPGGRFVGEGLPLTILIQRAFNPSIQAQLVDIPSWAGTTRLDVNAQAALEPNQAMDADIVAPMMLALLKERFGLKYHTEQRDLPAYDLVAAKPKMKAADPNSRTWCRAPQQVPGSAPAPQGSSALICQNVTMAQFATLLRSRTPDVQIVPRDLTGLEGGYDFRLTFNPLIGLLQQGRLNPEGGAPA